MSEQQMPDLAELKKQVEKLQQSNLEKIRALANMGKDIDAGAVANIKIDTFVRTFLDEGAQMVYVLNLESELKNVLDQVLSQTRQEIITNPSVGGLKIPKR